MAPVPPTPPSSNGHRMTGAERRTAVIEAAIAEFSRVGYHGATIASIAALAQCSEPTIYKHFRDKRAMLLASLQHAEQVVEPQIDEIVAGDAPIRQWLEFVERPQYRTFLQLRMLCTTLPEDVEVVELLRAGTERLLTRFRSAIERGKREGFVTSDVDPDHVAWTWLGLCFAAVDAVMIDGEHQYREAMDVARRYLVRAIGYPPPALPSS